MAKNIEINIKTSSGYETLYPENQCLKLSGGTVNGNLIVNGNTTVNGSLVLPNSPINGTDASNKNYVDGRYTAGNGININDGVVSAKAGEGITINDSGINVNLEWLKNNPSGINGKVIYSNIFFLSDRTSVSLPDIKVNATYMFVAWGVVTKYTYNYYAGLALPGTTMITVKKDEQFSAYLKMSAIIGSNNISGEFAPITVAQITASNRNGQGPYLNFFVQPIANIGDGFYAYVPITVYELSGI